jgi:spermidine synthase
VVELAEPLLAWAREGVTEQLGRVASHPRVELVAGDITDHVEGTWDAILLDVDNGPSFLIHDHNARLYRRDFLQRCLGALSPGGRLVIWCETVSPELGATLAEVATTVEEITVPVTRGERTFNYALYLAEGQP